MAKLTTLPLEELYSKEKKTTAVVAAIIEKSDFSTINNQYCDNICKLKCKNYKSVELAQNHVDVLIIQDHRNPRGRFDRTDNQQDTIQNNIIDFVCKEAGFEKYGLTYRITNLLKCETSDKDFPLGKPPTQTVLQKCFPYLDHELQRVKPKVIISLGTSSTKSLGLLHHSNTGNRGEVVESKYGLVVITLHPKVLTYIRQNARGSGGMWGPDYLNVIKRDFEKARKLVTKEVTWSNQTLSQTVNKLKNERIKIAKSFAEVKEICDTIKSLPDNFIISFDTETTSLDPLDPNMRLLTIQFGWVDKVSNQIKAGVIPLYHRKNTAYDPDLAWNEVKPILEDEKIVKAGHNSKYDILVIYWTKKVRVKGVKFDTLLLQHSIESGTQGCYGLKTMCWDHLFDLGFAGYEGALGSLSALKKAKQLSLKEESEESEEEIE